MRLQCSPGRVAEECGPLLERLPEEGKALAFSSHNFEQGTTIARRLVAMEAGRLRYDGPLDIAPLAALHIEADTAAARSSQQ